MEIIKATKGKAAVHLSVHELTTFINALDEVYKALCGSEFKTRMGGSREEVRSLSNSILNLLNGHPNGRNDIHFSTDELVTLNNALNEVCNGIKVPNFEVKMGTSRQEVRALLKSVGQMLDGLSSSDTLDIKPS